MNKFVKYNEEFAKLYAGLESTGVRLCGCFQCIYCGKYYKLEEIDELHEHIVKHYINNMVGEK